MIKKTDENIEKFKKEIEEWKSKYLRALADYQNLVRRIETEKKENIDNAEETAIKKLLPVFDDFKKLIKYVENHEDIEQSLKQGIILVFNQLNAVLEGYGFGRLDIKIGEEMFDPHKMECVAVGEGDDNKVLEEIEPGYTFRQKLIRPAKVKVGKKSN